MLGPWKRVAVVTFVVAVALGTCLQAVHAGPVVTGNFKIPFDATLGTTALPTGDYSVSVSEFAQQGTLTIYQGTKAVAMLRPQLFDSYENKGEKPVLIFVRHDGNTTLRAVRFPKAGTFYLPLPKELKTLVAQQPQLIETIAIQVSGD
jgi:hypothetical protein